MTSRTLLARDEQSLSGPRRRGLSCVVPDFLLVNVINHLSEGDPAVLAAVRDEDREERRRALLRGALDTFTTTSSFAVARIGQAEARRGQRQARRALRATRRRNVLGIAPYCTKERLVYTADNRKSLPGSILRKEGEGPTGDPAADEAYDGLGATLDLYCDAFGRNSIDDEGMALDATVHFGRDYDNAFWDGTQMVFGDGDGDIFNRFTIAIDIMGHELTHGVTENEAGLHYFKQPGALNEHISDVFGSLVKQFSHVPQQTAHDADWLIGEGLFNIVNVPGGRALRSMSEPGTAYDDPAIGTDPQPAHMRDYVKTLSDSGGVHVNSGIPNRAFYLVAAELGGYAWETTGEIWYQALLSPRLSPNANFQQFARLTIGVARVLYGPTSAPSKAVRDAWRAVGVVDD